jgi:hypothetical protein
LPLGQECSKAQSLAACYPSVIKALEGIAMSQVVTLELSDELCTALNQKAQHAGVSLSEWIQATLDRQSGLSNQQKTEADEEAARQRFRHHAGAIDLGYPTGADNGSIDADLARSYSVGMG